MSTRCNVHFTYNGDISSNIYVHSDGYPDGEHGIPALFQRFFADVEEQCDGDTRFEDPEYLAAKFLVWIANDGRPRYKEEKTLLNFLGVSPCSQDHGDIEWVYTVETKKPDPLTNGRPTVTWEEVSPFGY